MASKKKPRSFEIPDAVREAGQSGWVYRSEPRKPKAPGAESKKKATRRPRVAAAPAEESSPEGRRLTEHRVARPVPKEPVRPTPAARSEGTMEPLERREEPGVATASTGSAPVAEPPASAGAGEPAADALSSGLLGFGLHVAAVPFMVPLYVSAAISRRLGLADKQ